MRTSGQQRSGSLFRKTKWLRCTCGGYPHVGRIVLVKGEARVKWEGFELLERMALNDPNQMYITEEEYIRALLAGEIYRA